MTKYADIVGSYCLAVKELHEKAGPILTFTSRFMDGLQVYLEWPKELWQHSGRVDSNNPNTAHVNLSLTLPDSGVEGVGRTKLDVEITVSRVVAGYMIVCLGKRAIVPTLDATDWRSAHETIADQVNRTMRMMYG